jgi:hypothetical protein
MRKTIVNNSLHHKNKHHKMNTRQTHSYFNKKKIRIDWIYVWILFNFKRQEWDGLWNTNTLPMFIFIFKFEP